MGAVQAVGDAGDLGIGQGLDEEFEFAAAGVLVTHGHGEYGAIVLGNDERSVRILPEIGEVSVFVQDLGKDADTSGEILALHAAKGAFEPASTTTGENPGHHIRILILDIGQQFGGEGTVVPGKEGIASGRKFVPVPWTTRTGAFEAMDDETILFECGKVLAGTAEGDADFPGETIGTGTAFTLEDAQHELPGFWQGRKCDLGPYLFGLFGLPDVFRVGRGIVGFRGGLIGPWVIHGFLPAIVGCTGVTGYMVDSVVARVYPIPKRKINKNSQFLL